ncbi:MAG: sigma-70 family RNA polymerase sigma factor [Actinomycetota bacterium]
MQAPEYAGRKAGFLDVEQPVGGRTRQEIFAQHVLPEVEVLLRVARSLTRHPADAEDLVQDTLLRAYRAIDRFDGRHPRAWLLTILRNTHANRARGRRPEVVSNAEAAGATAPAAEEPESVVLRGTFDAAVERAFRALPEKFRLVVELVDLGGLSYQEVAVTLDVPIGTVMSRLHRGRGRIRAALEAAGLPGRKEN